MLTGLWPFRNIHAQLGHARWIWDGHRLWVGERLGGRPEGVPDARSSLWDGPLRLSAIRIVDEQSQSLRLFDMFRWTFRENIGLVYSNRHWRCGHKAWHPIQMYGVTGEGMRMHGAAFGCRLNRDDHVREIKFGALLDHLIITKDVDWIATGKRLWTGSNSIERLLTSYAC